MKLHSQSDGDLKEKKGKIKIRDICLMAVLGVILFVSQIALAFLPNIELVSLFVILFTLVFGKRVIGILAVFILAQGLCYGFGTWWLMYLYIWPLLALVTYLFRRLDSSVGWALIAGSYGLVFGFLCSLVYFVIGGIGGGIAYFISGIPFDIAHCIGNFCLTLLLYKKLRQVLESLNKKISRI
jgi:energy-coupling factor transport system substrate-specific component